MMHLLRTTPTAAQSAATEPTPKFTVPNQDSVQQVIGMLTDRSDPKRHANMVIAATVNNQPGRVRDRYRRFTADERNLSTRRLIERLQDMYDKGKRTLVMRQILNVPWQRGNGSALDMAVQSIGAEAAARVSAPETPYAKNLPTTGLPNNDMSGAASTGGGTSTGDSGAGADGSFWDSSFWTSLPGMIAAVTGQVANQPAAGTGGAQQPDPPSKTNWLNVVLLGLGAIAVVGIIIYIVKGLKK